MKRFEAAQLKPENHQQVLKFLDEILQRTKLSGISVVINLNNNLLDAAVGMSDVGKNQPMSSDIRFEVGCLNKFLVAIVVLELFNKGFIDIEKAISYYLPELRGRNGNVIKIKHLLSHTAGYQGENLADPDIVHDYTWQKFAQTFNQRLMLYEPGTVFDYSHSAAVILGKIIEAVTQRKALELVREFILKPLDIKVVDDERAEMTDYVSGYIFMPGTAQLQKSSPIDWCNFWSASLDGPWMTIRDLAKVGGALVEDSSIFSSTTKDLLLRQVVKLPGRFVGKVAEYPYFVFGLGCARFPNGSYGVRSNTSGQCCALRFDKINKLVIAVGINTNAAYIRDYIVDKLWNAMLSEDAPIIPEYYPSPQTQLIMDELVGNYQGLVHHSINISIENEQLALRIGHNPAIAYDTEAIVLTWVKNNPGCIVPLLNSIPISIGFFREPSSERLGLMMGENAYKKIDEKLTGVNRKSAINTKEYQVTN